MNALELFAGAGGLALGISRAGFDHRAVIEWDRDACHTIRENQKNGLAPLVDWPLHQTDVSDFDFSGLGEIDLIGAGVPCQPWSLGGKHRGQDDHRNLFPEALRAVVELRPKVILIENVKGLLRRSFAEYFQYIHLMLSHPEVRQRGEESWRDHLARLEKHHTKGKFRGLEYNVVYRLLNAADYGVPQRRERVFLVGFRADLGIEWSFPEPTHSQDALLYSQWVSRDYWDRHAVAKKHRPILSSRLKGQVDGSRLFAPPAFPWQTVRDAIHDLPDPSPTTESAVANHILNPGARSYPGHTGSPLDEPAKTLKAGDHGVPGGENMLAYPDGRLRYFTVRESARLQTFPEDFRFFGSWSENMRQLGNAVPVRIAEVIASEIRDKLASNARFSNTSTRDRI